MYLLVALTITLLVLLFANDINRAAHAAIGPRRSENRSFGQMVDGLVTSENNFDARLYYLLAHASTLSRPVFTARLIQLDQALSGWNTDAKMLRSPVLAHHVNDVVTNLTEQRVDDYQNLLSAIARRLTLPWTPAPVRSQAVTDPGQSLVVTVQQWDVARWALAREPGRVVLPGLTMASAKYYVARGLATLVSSPNLSLRRGVGIAAVSVNPSPLPAGAGVLLLPPVTTVQIGISVENTAFVEQPVTLHISFVPTSGVTQSQTMSALLGPLGAYAFVPNLFHTLASERARLTITISGAPAGGGLPRTRTYQVKMSPSGNG